MSEHVTALALERFVAHGEASPDFEAHVDACPFCAANLRARALDAMNRAPRRPLAWRGPVLAFAAAFGLLVVLGRPAPLHAEPSPVATSPAAPLAAGIPDAGVLDPSFTAALAFNDAG